MRWFLLKCIFNVIHPYYSELRELSKRTTFIRVSQQINEVFGSKDESKNPVFAAIADPTAPDSKNTEDESAAKKQKTDP